MSTPAVTPITSYKQFKELLESGKTFVIDFWATWCGPCRQIRPIFEKLAEKKEFTEKLEFYSVDVDEQAEIAQEVGITAMPTFIAFKDGKKLSETIGAVPAKLNALISQAVAA
ncbi:thioredoxin [Calocera cornea HHB12733]|uniref:Thioredoxin n=1 Tax=Calocera cornea HHB12733 TaxID=1353952 RepID=A0A165K5D4_9BASI|nr:thioredoxin [Calocera cornea HHB12733]